LQKNANILYCMNHYDITCPIETNREKRPAFPCLYFIAIFWPDSGMRQRCFSVAGHEGNSRMEHNKKRAKDREAYSAALNGSGIQLQLCDLLVRDLLVGLQACHPGGKLGERDDIVSLYMLQGKFSVQGHHLAQPRGNSAKVGVHADRPR